MPTNYAGDPNVYPEEALIPSDGDEPDGSSVNPGFEALFDRTAYLKRRIHFVAVTAWSRADSASPSNYASFTTDEYVELAASELVLTVSAGDSINVDAFLQALIDDGTGWLRVVYQFDADPKVEIIAARVNEVVSFSHVTLSAHVTAPQAGDMRFVIEGKVVEPNQLDLYYAASLRLTQFGTEVNS